MTELLQSGTNCFDRSSCYPTMESDKLLQPGGEDESEHQSTPTQARHHLRLRNWTSSNKKTILPALLLMSCAVNILQSAYVIAWYNPPMRDGPACGEYMQLILDLLTTKHISRTIISSDWRSYYPSEQLQLFLEPDLHGCIMVESRHQPRLRGSGQEATQSQDIRGFSMGRIKICLSY